MKTFFANILPVLYTVSVMAFGFFVGYKQGETFVEEKLYPTKLYLTVVDEQNLPQVCIFDIATETVRGDNLRVVVHASKCGALH